MEEENDEIDDNKIVSPEQEIDETIEKEIEKEVFGDEAEIIEEDDVAIGIASEDEIIDRPTTKVQYNGRSYIVVIPLSIIEESELAKGDEIEWEVEELPDGKALKGYINDSGAFKLPVEEREDGR